MSELCAVSKYEQLKNEIRQTMDKHKDYHKAVDLCKDLELMLKEDKDCQRHDYWFLYTVLAKNYKNINKVELSLEYAELSTIFANNDAQRHHTYWSLAMAYSNLENSQNAIEKAIEYYNKCIYYYSSNEKIDFLISVIANKSSLLGKIEDCLHEANNALELYNKCEKDDFTIDSNLVLDGVYENTAKIYIKFKDELNACRYIKKITNEEIKHNLRNKLLNCNL